MALTVRPIRWTASALAIQSARDGALSVGAAIAALVNRYRASRALAGFDGRMLADIGLTLGDLQSAFAEPIWRDPTRRLAVIAVERRCAARAARQHGRTGHEEHAPSELIEI